MKQHSSLNRPYIKKMQSCPYVILRHRPTFTFQRVHVEKQATDDQNSQNANSCDRPRRIISHKKHFIINKNIFVQASTTVLLFYLILTYIVNIVL